VAAMLFGTLCSVDGYAADSGGRFEWASPDPEVHQAVNDVQRSVGTLLLGRRTYEVLRAWDDLAPDSPAEADYRGLWAGADKVVYSAGTDLTVGPRTRLARRFDPADVARVKEWADRDLAVGGPTLAASAFAAGLVDAVHLFVAPVAVGGGLPALPPGQRLDLTLTAERRFASGFVHLAYRVRR
jgi:dihydrofolate reductase